MSGIESKVVVITGASSGIGEATVLLLAERSAKVVLGQGDRIGLRLSLNALRQRAARQPMHQQTSNAFPSSKPTLHYFSTNAGVTEVPPWSEVRADNTEGLEKPLSVAR